MDPKIATMIVTGVVTVGTLLYYLFFDNKNHQNKPHSHNGGRSSGSSSSSGPTTSYEDIRQRRRSPNTRASNRARINERNDARRNNEPANRISVPSQNDEMRASSSGLTNSSESSRDSSACLVSSSSGSAAFSTAANNKESLPRSSSSNLVCLTAASNAEKVDTSVNDEMKSPGITNSFKSSPDSLASSFNRATSGSAEFFTAANLVSTEGATASNAESDHFSKKLVSDMKSQVPSNDKHKSVSSTVNLLEEESKSSEVPSLSRSKSITSLNPTPGECKACKGLATIQFIPCNHSVFCKKHAEKYLKLAETKSLEAKCPEPNCLRLITKLL